MVILWLIATLICVSGVLEWAHAQQVIVLKNGRQITVQSYREEGSTIKFTGLGGEIGLPKDQIQAILKPGESNRPGVNISDLEAASRQTPKTPPKTSASPQPSATRLPSVEEPKSVTDDEAKEYHKRLAELTEKLQKTNREYFAATQGGGIETNASNEGIRSWAMDLASRIHDSQKVPGGGGPSSTPPTPPYAPVYTAKERELSDLRAQIDRLQKERDALIQEMKSKNIPTG